MEDIIRSIYTLWTAKDIDGVLNAFHTLGPKGYTIEYVGNAPLEGEAALRDMWDNYGASCTTEVVQLIVNGNEAAALIDNNIAGEDGITTLPSIETYHVKDGVLTVRYYHHTPEDTFLSE